MMIMILYVNEILIEFSYPTYGKGKSSSQPLGGDMLVPRRVFKKRERERETVFVSALSDYTKGPSLETHMSICDRQDERNDDIGILSHSVGNQSFF